MGETLPGSTLLPLGYEFHHLGYATESIAKDRRWFAGLSYQPEGEEFADPLQGIMGQFLVGLGPRIELLQNLPDQQTLTPWLNKGVRIYHFGYLVANVSESIDWARGQGAKLIVPPVSSVAFKCRPIAFVMLRNGMMLEFIEK